MPAPEPVPQPARPRDRWLRVTAGIAATILIVAALALARPVFAPLSFALFTVAIVWPLQARLQRSVPKLVALAVSFTATILVIAAFGWVIGWGFSRVGHYLVADAAHLESRYKELTAWLGEDSLAAVSLWTDSIDASWVLGAAGAVTARLNGALSFTVIVIIYALVGLLELDVITRRLARMDNEPARILLVAGAESAAKMRRFLLVRALMSLITGILVWAVIALCGLPLAVEWGTIAFALNFIPVIGPLVATVLPTLFAVAEVGGWHSALLVFVCLYLVQFLVDNYLEPRVAGSLLSISPILVLFAVLFWSFLWGIAGAFIGVPIVLVILAICDHTRSARWVAELFGAHDERPSA